MNKYLKYQTAVLNACIKLVDTGILIATGGNLSTRVLGEDKIAITPSNKDYTLLKTEEICVLDYDGNQISGAFNPSIEYKFHIEIYKNRLDVGGVVHSHQPNGSQFSLINTKIPAIFDEQVFHLGEIIDVIPYEMSGTEDLARSIVQKLHNGANAYVMENHGVLCLGGSMEEAALNAMVTEKVAVAYHGALSTEKRISKLPRQSLKHFGELFSDRKNHYKKLHSDAYN